MKKMRPSLYHADKIDDCRISAEQISALLQYEGRWLESMRQALGWSLEALARKRGISQQALWRLQRRERSGAISIGKLREIATDMNCQFVYGFVHYEAVSATAHDLYQRQADARRRKQTMPRPA